MDLGVPRKEASKMYLRLATQIRKQLPTLLDQYDAQLRDVPGYASLPEPARRDLEQRVLQIMAECLETGDDGALIQYIHERAEQVLARGFQPEWFQQAITVAEETITPLIKKVDEGSFVWRAMNHAQATAWQIVARERQRIELTLRESEARYQTIFDSTPIMFWLKDAHNRTLRINRAAAALEGVNPADVEGKSAYDLYPHEQAEAFFQDDLAVINSNQPKLGIVEQHTSVGTGKLMWLETGKTPVHNDQGETIGVLAFAVDITERKQAEEILHQSAGSQQRAARYLRATIDSTNELTQIQDLDTLYRRTVELAREKFDIERCGLYLIDESGQSMLGTYGTDDQRQTTNERDARRLASDFEEVLTAQQDQYWVVRDTSHVFIEDGVEHTVGAGWVVNTVLRGAAGPIGILFNDRALSGQSVDPAQQEALAVYCSAVGSIIERKRAEDDRRAAFEKERIASERLRVVLTATDELTRLTDLDLLYRRTVELAREKLGVERCGLFMVDPTRQYVLGTYGTDDQGQTTDEHAAREPIANHQSMFISERNFWVVQEAPQKHWEGSEERTVGTGWVGGTALRGAAGPIGVLYNDASISQTPPDPDLQEVLAVYCSAVGSIIERKRAEEERHAAFENERIASDRLRAIVTATDELIRTTDLDVLYRRAVELAREKLGVERCALYVLDESREWVLGTYGTDAAGHTTDERSNKEPAQNHQIISMPREQQWVTFQTELKYWEGEQDQLVGTGWNVATAIRSATGPIGIMFNDTAISRKPYDEGLQQSLALYCSMLANIIENKRLELQIRRSLQLRSSQVQTSTEVAQEIAAASESAELFHRVVTLIKERFNYYHAQIFRYDPAHDAAVLVAGYGEVGQKMLAAKHQLPMGRGVVGSAAATGESILAADVRQDEDWRSNPNLPETRGELAVPIKLRDQVLGVLDVQSAHANTLTDDDRLLLEGLCGQIAIAMESTRLLEELRRGEAELSQALQIAKLAYWEYDVEKDLFLFNDQFYSIFHTTAAQEGGYQLSSAQYAGKFVYPDDLPVVGGEIERALNSTDRHYSRDVVHRIQYADGGVGYISVSINIDRDEQGHILRYYGANQDITANKLAEVELEKFKMGLERSNSAIFITDPQGVISYVNPAFETVYGYSREEALGQTPRLFKSGVIPQEQYQHFWSTLLSKQTAAGEIINKTKDGRLIPIEASNNPILNEAGEIVGFLGVHTDITQRKRTEEELARSAQLLNTIINTSRDLIYIKNTKSEFLVASQAVARLLGAKTADELIGRSDFDFFPYELANKYYTDEQNIIQAGEPLIDIEELSVYPDGTQIWLLTTKIPYRAADGTLLGLLGIGRDITERKRAEQQMEETLRETERLYAAVSAEGWKAFRQSGQLPQGYLFNRTLLQPAGQIWEPEMAQAVSEEKTIATHGTDRAVAVSPVAVRGAVIGALGVYDDPAHPLPSEDLALIEAVSEQVALALEGARLFEQTQRDADREHTINRITGRIRNARSVEEVLTVATQELRLATQATRSVVEIAPHTPQPATSGNGEGVKA
jgi:PAS domain S-box-containing protein